jgi:hypothetical protein
MPLLRECLEFVELPMPVLEPLRPQKENGSWQRLRWVDGTLPYPGQSGWVLDSLISEILRGEGLALVGVSGSDNPDHLAMASMATAAT